MTQEGKKELLLNDLCARLPYRVKCCIYNFGGDTIRIKEDILWSVQGDNILTLKSYVEKGEAYMYHQIKPYLFPISSMTEEQKEELFFKYIHNDIYFDDFTDYFLAGELWHDIHVSMDILPELINWLNKNHLDYRGLIPMGLANDATGLNIYKL